MKVVIVGAGPAGILSAALFARRGHQVEVYEARTLADITKQPQHSFTIVLSHKGLSAIKYAGIDTSELFDFPLKACVRHYPSGRTETFLKPALGTAANFERSELTAWLLQHVKSRHPGIHFNLQHSLHSAHLQDRVAVFSNNSTQDKLSVRYSTLSRSPRKQW